MQLHAHTNTSTHARTRVQETAGLSAVLAEDWLFEKSAIERAEEWWKELSPYTKSDRWDAAKSDAVPVNNMRQ